MALKCYWAAAKRRLDFGREPRLPGLRSDALLNNLGIAMFEKSYVRKSLDLDGFGSPVSGGRGRHHLATGRIQPTAITGNRAIDNCSRWVEVVISTRGGDVDYSQSAGHHLSEPGDRRHESLPVALIPWPIGGRCQRPIEPPIFDWIGQTINLS